MFGRLGFIEPFLAPTAIRRSNVEILRRGCVHQESALTFGGLEVQGPESLDSSQLP